MRKHVKGNVVGDVDGDALGKRCSMPEKVPLRGLQLWVTHDGVWTPLRTLAMGYPYKGRDTPEGLQLVKEVFHCILV